MTTFLNTYSFMDLLKDYDYVPDTDQNETSFMDEIEDVFSPIAEFFKAGSEDYDFMDLLHDKGYTPTASDKAVWIASNDNDIVIQVAS